MKSALNTSWIAGKYEIQGEEAEINTAYSYISIGDFFAQGEEAEAIIDEIFTAWDNGEITQEEAIKNWALNNI